MTGAERIQGPANGGVLAQFGRWLALAAAGLAGVFVLFLSATFALIAVAVIACIALLAVAVFYVRAKLTGRPFGPRAHMEARMAELRRQMDAAGASGFASPFGTADADTVVIDLEETPQGWTVER